MNDNSIRREASRLMDNPKVATTEQAINDEPQLSGKDQQGLSINDAEVFS
jgi:hypothetical protein